jgi:uncharacterized tellurite resistance protein B-like protein
MIDAFMNLFKGSPNEPAPESPDERLALAALLVDAARRDDDYEDEEKAVIDRILAAEHGLDAAAATALRIEAESAQDEAMGLFRFTHSLKEATPFEDRVKIVEYLWEVALADGDRDAVEDNLVRRVCGLLGVSDKDSGLARKRVEARL